MKKLEIIENQFKINGKNTFIIGGEFHYFRVKREFWEDRMKKIKDSGCNLVSTYVPWIVHETEEGIYDFSNEKNLVEYLELAKKYGLYVLLRPGPYVMSELKNEGIPNWLLEKYPEIIALDIEGKKHSTKVITYNHPKFLEKVRTWYLTFSNIIKDYLNDPIIMIQLDNEIGMLQWVTNTPDYSEYILNKFGRTKNIQEIKEKLKNADLGLQNEYMKFIRQEYKKYFDNLKEILAENGIDLPFIVNVHGFITQDYAKRAIDYPIGLSQLYNALDVYVTAGDYYIGNIVPENFSDIELANSFTKAVQNKNQPLFSAEFQGGSIFHYPKLQPTTFDLTSRLCIANGMKGYNYYMFVGGEHFENIWLFNRRHDWQAPISSDGSLKLHYQYISKLSKKIKAIEDILLKTEEKKLIKFGFIIDYYMTEYNTPKTKEIYDNIKNQRDIFLFKGFLRGLIQKNYHFDSIDLYKDNINDIPTLIVFSLEYMDDIIQKKLVNYIKNGGNLIIYPSIPDKNLKGETATILKDYIGIKNIERYKWNFVNGLNIDNISTPYVESYEIEDVNNLGYIENNGNKCFFEKQIDKGKVIVMGFGFEMNYDHHYEFIDKLLSKEKIIPLSSNDDLNIHIREYKDTKLVFINNYNDYDVISEINYYTQPLFDSRKIKVKMRSGLILLINYPIGDEKIIYSTCEIIEIDKNKIIFEGKQEEEFIKLSFRPKAIDKNIKITKEEDGYLLTVYNSKKIIIERS